jgi:hypothetical protein
MASTVQNQAATSAAPIARSQTATSTVHPFMRVARVLGSIQLALAAGSIFTLALIIGTCLESWYSDVIAQELVYYSWWFLLLLGLLATCIFFAAVKKWPWKPHQTGFLITHVGLLTMLSGGVLNFAGGLDGTMSLIDNRPFGMRNGIPQRSNMVNLTHEPMISLDRVLTDKDGKPQQKTMEMPVNPGPLPWGTDLGKSIEVPPLIRVMSALANPLPRGTSRMLYDDVRVETLAFLPHTRIEPLESAKEKEFGFPAIKLELNAREFGHRSAEWLALSAERGSGLAPFIVVDPLGVWAELLGQCDTGLVDEFLKPPGDAERGAQGQLVFLHQGKKIRVNVAEQMGKSVPLGDGWKVQLDSYSPRTRPSGKDEVPDMPIVRCTVLDPAGKATKYLVSSRLSIYPGPLDHLDEPVAELPAGLPAVWYHVPDLRYGYDGSTKERPQVRSLLQFVQTPDKKLYYRSFLEENGKLVLEGAAQAPAPGLSRSLWNKHAGSFVIEEHLPHAKPCSQRVEPVDLRPGLDNPEFPAALLCRVTLYKKASNGERKAYSIERWAPLRQKVQFELTGKHDGEEFSEPFELRYSHKLFPLGFDLELSRAESQIDPGSTRAATYTSFVKVFDMDLGMNGQDFMITMNEPLDHRGYKVYQSQFRPAGVDPETKKPIALSGFTIGRDPGLWLKYLGTAMLGVGIATMYYMKAYFLTGKRRTPSTAS